MTVPICILKLLFETYLNETDIVNNIRQSTQINKNKYFQCF
jgi:hypothetical protein